jgi:hypothetical protein
MSEMAEAPGIPLSVVVLTGCTTVVLASALAFVFWKSNKYVSSSLFSFYYLNIYLTLSVCSTGELPRWK